MVNIAQDKDCKQEEIASSSCLKVEKKPPTNKARVHLLT